MGTSYVWFIVSNNDHILVSLMSVNQEELLNKEKYHKLEIFCLIRRKTTEKKKQLYFCEIDFTVWVKLTVGLPVEPGRWHNGSTFVFCLCSCTFKSEPSPTYAHACGEVTGCAPAAKRSASVAPEVNLGECTLHLPPQK